MVFILSSGQPAGRGVVKNNFFSLTVYAILVWRYEVPPIPGLCLGTDNKFMDIIALGVKWSHGVRVGLEVKEFF